MRQVFRRLGAAGLFVAALALAAAGGAEQGPAPAKLRIIAFGAHPDDCDLRAGGTAARWAALGHQVKFVAVTNGDAGHQTEGGGALAKRRRLEAQEAGRRFGIAEYETLDNHDGELLPSLYVREQMIRRIRQWGADVVLGPRPNDYHPDHRYTGVLLQDAVRAVVVRDQQALARDEAARAAGQLDGVGQQAAARLLVPEALERHAEALGLHPGRSLRQHLLRRPLALAGERGPGEEKREREADR